PDMAEYYRRTWRGDESMALADYEETHVTLSAVDAVVSPVSTILLEAALHGKAIAAYLPDEDVPNLHLFTVVRTVHYREFFDRVECLRIERRDELVSSCAHLLELAGRPDWGESLKKQCEYFVASRPESYAEQLRQTISALAGEAVPGVRVG